MKGSHVVSRLALACAVVLVSGLGGLAGLAQAPQPEDEVGTAFTYQGRLTDGGGPADGTYDFQFELYDAFDGDNLLGTVTPGDVPVSGGLFTVKLDFGSNLFSGDERWLQIGVRPGASSGAYTPLTPRQELTPAPYALALPGLWTQQNDFSPNLIGGHSGNWVAAGVTGATIGGGGDIDWPNRVTDHFGTVGGGQNNQAGDGDADPAGPRDATVGGGMNNTAGGWRATVGGGGNNVVSGQDATIAGGNNNAASDWGAVVGGGGGNVAGGSAATVAGGHSNSASSGSSTVGGGKNNTASGESATVGGGFGNTASGDTATVGGGDSNAAGGWRATVAGGWQNIASGTGATVGGWQNTASGGRATVGGGWGNMASGDTATVGGGNENTASGSNATVPGGYDNIAQGAYSFAAGRTAKAYNDGCFVWGDSTDAADVSCSNNDRWVARASGGVYFYTNSILSSGVYVPAGGNAWSSVSDRNLKENVASVDGQEVLARLAQVPITSWSYKSQDAATRHMGPMAQDFYAAFGVGEDDTLISTVDADGVALAAIQGLYAENQALKAENADQEQQLDELTARVAVLEKGRAPAHTGGLPLGWLALGGVTVAAGLVVQRRRDGGGR